MRFTRLVLLTLTAAGCGGHATTSPSSSRASLDGRWDFTAEFSDATRACSQRGTLMLSEGGLTKGTYYSFLVFSGTLNVTYCSCPDLVCVGGPADVGGDFTTGSFLEGVGEWEAGLGRYFECKLFTVREAQPNRLSGPVDCSFGPWTRRPAGQPGSPYVASWSATGVWVAVRTEP